ncbi:MAG: hypothetical protein IJB02_02570 [Oscillospiraceae bacterium]|nr:hypothetical protein [Oscillospiraceae bacterium]
MKKILSMILICATLFSITGCSIPKWIESVTGYKININIEQANSTTPASTVAATEATVPSTVPSTEPTQAPTVPATEPQEAAPKTPTSKVPYLQKVKQSNCPYYKGPGYNYKVNGTIKKPGTFTIVKEQYDDDGNLWGKLKSGVGWINLTEVKAQSNSKPMITVAGASKSFISGKNYHHIQAGDPEYYRKIKLTCRETYTDVLLYELVIDMDEDKLEQVGSVKTWNSNKAIYAELSYPGDFSEYVIRITDKNGKQHWFSLYESGKDGSICIEAYKP